MNASKAFDRTNHNLLFAKLVKRNVPMCIVRLLLSWYRQQTMQVKWGANYSSPFTVTTGVRQGGVLSPYLFAVYLDELSIQLGLARVGCTVGNMVVNHLMFADDIWLYVCSAPVLVGCNVFWIFVVTMLRNTKSLLIVTKQLVFFFAQKSINNLPHQMFFSKWCTCTIFRPSEISWCVDKWIIEAWWWHSETSEIIILCSKQTQRHFWSVLTSSKNTLFRAYCMPMYACQLWSKYTQTSMKRLRAAYIITMPIELCITYAEMLVFAHTRLTIVSGPLMPC